MAGANFAEAFGENLRAEEYRQVAQDIKQAVEKHIWQPDLDRFAKMVYQNEENSWEVDSTIDASLSGLWQFGMYPPDDPKIISTMQAIRERLWVKTPVGGIARYENDGYHQVSQDLENVPGNPWFISTLWVAEWLARTAQSEGELAKSQELLAWVPKHALPSGIMAEQLHPYTGEPLSVSPLTWSHAAFVNTVLEYLKASDRLA
jgi:GH15 family glucan-1,4-alpha-glucosidase